MKEHKVGDLMVWWVPQIGMGIRFEVDVFSVEEGVKIMDVLADYDAFQFKNRIKPDYCNTGGLNRWCEDSDGDGEYDPGWEIWYDEETGEDNPKEWLRREAK